MPVICKLEKLMNLKLEGLGSGSPRYSVVCHLGSMSQDSYSLGLEPTLVTVADRGF